MDCILLRNENPADGGDPYWKLDGPGFELHLNGTTISYIAGDVLRELDFRLAHDAKSILLGLVNWPVNEILECVDELPDGEGYVFESPLDRYPMATDMIFMIGEAARCHYIGGERYIRGFINY